MGRDIHSDLASATSDRQLPIFVASWGYMIYCAIMSSKPTAGGLLDTFKSRWQLESVNFIHKIRVEIHTATLR